MKSNRFGSRRKTVRYTALLLIGCFLSSCATIRRGRDEIVSVDSNPSGANATIECAGNVSANGSTPARLTIPRIADHCLLRIEKAGMRTESIKLERGFNSHYWMNFTYGAGVPIGTVLLFAGNDAQAESGGVIAVGSAILVISGLVIDRVTGAMYDHDPNVIKVTLQPDH
jgi:hypothetical protein